MGRIATDVVLLPDEATMERAIEINRQLITDHHPKIVLGKEDRLPHISLAMGCVDEADIEAIQELLEKLVQETTVDRLSLVGVLSWTNSHGETTSVLEIERTEELQSLHERVMEEMKPFFRHDAVKDMIHDDVVTPSTQEWIRDYPAKASFDRFVPHITLGYGEAKPDLFFPHLFRATRLALCHLGNHCTCREILASANLV
jgi:2'-5' RNA ligase